MTDIDWSKAPEGATHYYDRTGEWYKVSANGDAMAWTGSWTTATMFGYRHDACIRRPAPSWSGEGLPPVGTVCEMRHKMWESGKWEKVTIMYASNDYVIAKFTRVEQHYHAHSVMLRPIRTPEQIAKDERDKAIDEIRRELMPQYEKMADQVLDMITALGYRKP